MVALPLLTGRYCWGRKKNGEFEEVSPEPAFKGLITDAEHDAIKVKLAAGNMHPGLRGRETRMFSSLVRCKDCGSTLAYKTFPKANVIYLRCSNIRCDKRSKGINIDQVFGVLQYAVTMHAEALVPVLSGPRAIPRGVEAAGTNQRVGDGPRHGGVD